MDGREISTGVKLLLPSTNPLESIMSSYFLDLLNHVSKFEDCTEICFSLGMLSLGTDETVFDDEVEVIQVALTHLKAYPTLSGQFVNFSDSQAAILKLPVMSRRKQRSAFDQVSEFDRGRIVAYRDCGLPFRKIGSRVGRNQTTVMRIRDRWIQESTTD
ncbi:transposable element Tcb1 transposase [Trichonephila clavipes]|nr:transposable element Tcb1 transposase [Trichonephila clavipes]